MPAKVFHVVAFVFGLFLALTLGGCSGNRWSEAYTPSVFTADAMAAPGLIQPNVLVVPPNRMLQAIDAESKFLAARSRTRLVSPREQRDLQREQFALLGLHADPASTMLMGTSEVTADKPLDPHEPAITAAAEEAGASIVVVSVFPPGTPGGLPIPAPVEGERKPPTGLWRGLAWYYAPAR